MWWLVLTCALLPLCGVCHAREPLARSDARVMSNMGRGDRALSTRVVERPLPTPRRAKLKRPSRARPSTIPRASSGFETGQVPTGRATGPLRKHPQPLEPPSANSPLNPARGGISSAFGCDD